MKRKWSNDARSLKGYPIENRSCLVTYLIAICGGSAVRRDAEIIGRVLGEPVLCSLEPEVVPTLYIAQPMIDNDCENDMARSSNGDGTFDERCAALISQKRAVAEALPQGFARQALELEIRQLEAVSNIDLWPSSVALRSKKGEQD